MGNYLLQDIALIQLERSLRIQNVARENGFPHHPLHMSQQLDTNPPATLLLYEHGVGMFAIAQNNAVFVIQKRPYQQSNLPQMYRAICIRINNRVLALGNCLHTAQNDRSRLS